MFKKYRSHKVVEAVEIARVEETAEGPKHEAKVTVHTVDGDAVSVPANFCARGAPGEGDYLIRYSGGYLSHSPKAAFEEGYTAVDG